MTSRARIAVFAGALLLTLLLRPAISSYFAEPLGLIYALVVRYVESLPQIYLWAGLLAIFVLAGLRRIPLASRKTSAERPAGIKPRGRLGNWVGLLADRHRGAYFEWRLANRLAELEEWIGAADTTDHQQRAYLEIGRDARTIKAEHELARLNFKLDELVGYLEDALHRS